MRSPWGGAPRSSIGPSTIVGRPAECSPACRRLTGCARSVSTQVPSNLVRCKIAKPNMYHESKLVAREYQAAKACLFRAFLKAGLGAWVEKPTEQDQFALTP